MPDTTKTARVLADLTERIASGEYRPDQRLPSRRQMASEYEVSEQVVRIVMERLMGAGVVYSLPRGGYYVRKRPDE